LVLILPIPRVVRAGEPKLAGDEAIVLCRGDSPTLRYVEYWRVGVKTGFSITMRGVLTPRVVKAGRYYLHSYSTVFRNVFPPEYPEPTDMTATVDVRPGSVTYFGDLTAAFVRQPPGIKWSFALALKPDTLLQAAKSYPWLKKYPLYVSTAGGEAVPVSWSTDPIPPVPVPGDRLYGDERRRPIGSSQIGVATIGRVTTELTGIELARTSLAGTGVVGAGLE
jgi:hypothetical protein